MNKEIGGYLEIEHYHGTMLHDSAIKLNSGRSCLSYLILANGIKKIKIPFLLCDCIEKVCLNMGVKVSYYHINDKFEPENVTLEKDEWLYVVNYYGLVSEERVIDIKSRYSHVILDNAHAYFNKQIEGIDTLYTCRKFFGVPDGGILYSNLSYNVKEQDESFEKYYYLAGRYERSGKDFYGLFLDNEEKFYFEYLKVMSKLTENILRSFDYDKIELSRKQNYYYLNEKLEKYNRLQMKASGCPYMYPFMIENADQLREKLIEEKIYVPVFWKSALEKKEINDLEVDYVNNIIPLPIDQRYGEKEMCIIVESIENNL